MDVSGWANLQLVEQIAEGNRNEVWRGELDNRSVAVRQSRRESASLSWELDLLAYLATFGVLVPSVIAADDGSRSLDGIVVQEWIDGTPPVTEHEWDAVATELRQVHRVGAAYAQRPGCCACFELADQRRSVDADLDAMPAEAAGLVASIFAGFEGQPVALVHGDPDPSNLRITVDGRVGLLDWDESRVDVAWHDLSNLGVQVLDDADHASALRLSNAWEAANAWTHEPAYAQRRFALLVDG